MPELGEAHLENLVVHKVAGEEIIYSQRPFQLSDEVLKNILQKYFLHPFKNEVYHHLSHPSDIKLNEIYHFAGAIFKDPGSLYQQSVNIAKHLAEASKHPNIKSGELYVCYFSNCTVDGEYADAIGIFKSESKDLFLKVYEQDTDMNIEHQEGININKLDKGCLIFNIDEDKGYRVCVTDKTNKAAEAQYWKDEFLQIKPREDSFFHTKTYLQLCRNFCDEVLDEKEKIEKTDQIDFLNRSSSFFKTKETFNVQEFEDEVIAAPQIIDQFRDYRQSFESRAQVRAFDEFDISRDAVKKNQKVFKSVLKLDKNFHIYIHGNRNLIEKGYDEDRGMSFYKVFFTEEQD